MSQHVQFDEGEDMAYQAPSQKKSFLMRIAMKLGAKDERQANIMLLVVAFICIAMATILFLRLAGVTLIPAGDVNGEQLPPDTQNAL